MHKHLLDRLVHRHVQPGITARYCDLMNVGVNHTTLLQVRYDNQDVSLERVLPSDTVGALKTRIAVSVIDNLRFHGFV